MVVSTVASQQECSRFDPFMCGLCMFSPCMCGFSPGLSKSIHVRLIDVSKLSPRSVCVWLFVSVWPCDGLATCPGCTPPLAQ